ncbi:MAG: hypothetical protein AAB589_02845 [Patescibacteria group bacterium]
MKKLVVGLGLMVVISVWSLWFIGGRSAPKLENNFLMTKKVPPLAKFKPTDQDQDKLADWEETLWGTNPNKPDSDGDGVADGAEVSLGRDPSQSTNQPLEVNAKLLAQVHEASQNREAPLINSEVFWPKQTTYQISDLHLLSSATQPQIRAYGLEVAEIMRQSWPTGEENELVLALNFIENGENQTLTKLEERVTAYKNTSQTLLNLAIPQTAAQNHLNLVNAITNLTQNSLLMAQIESEPAIALAAAELHPTKLEGFFTAINNLNFFLMANGLVFNENEGANLSLGL